MIRLPLTALILIVLTGSSGANSEEAMQMYLQQNPGYEDKLINARKIWVDEVVCEPLSEGIAMRNMLKQALLDEGKGRFIVVASPEQADVVLKASSGRGGEHSFGILGFNTSSPKLNLTVELHDAEKNDTLYFCSVLKKGSGKKSAEKAVKDLMKTISRIERRRAEASKGRYR